MKYDFYILVFVLLVTFGGFAYFCIPEQIEAKRFDPIANLHAKTACMKEHLDLLEVEWNRKGNNFKVVATCGVTDGRIAKVIEILLPRNLSKIEN